MWLKCGCVGVFAGAATVVSGLHAAALSTAAVPMLTGTYTGKLTSLQAAKPNAPWASATIVISRESTWVPGAAAGMSASGVLWLRGLQKSFSCSTRFVAKRGHAPGLLRRSLSIQSVGARCHRGTRGENRLHVRARISRVHLRVGGLYGQVAPANLLS